MPYLPSLFRPARLPKILLRDWRKISPHLFLACRVGQRFLRGIWPHRFALLFLGLLLVYGRAVSLHPALPGVNPDLPLGWWGWWDQSQYLKSTLAFAQGIFAKEYHHYPPLYSLLAVPFVFIWPQHPFWLINFICLWMSCLAFLRVAEAAFPQWITRALFWLGLLFALWGLQEFTLQNWIIPWTTTLAVALFSGIVLLWLPFAVRAHPWQLSGRKDWLGLFLGFLLWGLLALCRPYEAIVFLPLALYGALVVLARHLPLWLAQKHWHKIFLYLVAGGVTALAPLAAFILFNFTLQGEWLGGYLAISKNIGFHFADVPEKFISLFFDSATLYGEADQAIANKIPFFPAACVVAVVALFTLSGLVRIVTLCAVLQIILYLPYADLLPIGMFRFGNIHYFKWAILWITGLSCVLPLLWLYQRRFRVLVSMLALMVLCYGLRLETESSPMMAQVRADGIFLRPLKPLAVDFIDFPQIQGDFTSVYFGQHTLQVDGQALRLYGAFRLLPLPEDRGVRLLFMRPHKPREILFTPDPKLARHAPDVASIPVLWGQYFFGLF